MSTKRDIADGVDESHLPSKHVGREHEPLGWMNGHGEWLMFVMLTD